MLSFILFAVTLSVAVAVNTTRCCPPSVFEVTILQSGGSYINGTSTRIDGFTNVFFDGDNNRITALSHSPGTDTIRTILDYNSKITYTIKTTASGLNCTSTRMPADAQIINPCVPSNATHMGTHYFGAASDRVLVNTWSYTTMPDYTTNEYIMTENDCTPVARNMFYGNAFGGGVIMRLFTNFKRGISFPFMTQPPAQCTSS
ncbi:hypothetical protein ScPMuIL_004951 [Solemya velum]